MRNKISANLCKNKASSLTQATLKGHHNNINKCLNTSATCAVCESMLFYSTIKWIFVISRSTSSRYDLSGEIDLYSIKQVFRFKASRLTFTLTVERITNNGGFQPALSSGEYMCPETF